MLRSWLAKKLGPECAYPMLAQASVEAVIREDSAARLPRLRRITARPGNCLAALGGGAPAPRAATPLLLPARRDECQSTSR